MSLISSSRVYMTTMYIPRIIFGSSKTDTVFLLKRKTLFVLLSSLTLYHQHILCDLVVVFGSPCLIMLPFIVMCLHSVLVKHPTRSYHGTNRRIILLHFLFVSYQFKSGITNKLHFSHSGADALCWLLQAWGTTQLPAFPQQGKLLKDW